MIAATASAGSATASGTPPQAVRVFADDFRDGLNTSGPAARWRLRPAGALSTGDAVVTTSAAGLFVRAAGSHPQTSEPAFTWNARAGENDNLKWAAFAVSTAASGMPGFDVVEGGSLTCSADVSARTFGVARHPLADPSDPDGDPRPGAGAVVLADLATGLVCDLLITSTRVLALYERIRVPANPDTTFSYVIPVARREPETLHRYAISYDDRTATTTWTLDGIDVLTVAEPGLRCLPQRYLLGDSGGATTLVRPRQLTVGLALLTLFDVGEHRGPRLCGQGAALSVRRIEVHASR